ncbi:Glu/Leu/Phe/Val dehydrogenase [bacterium]|nr:Glu/Leu/Phe/Val dehydrogenase [bacterium]
MTIFSQEAWHQHDSVHFFRDSATGLRAIVAIHDTTLGPALGGCRLWNYNTETEAIRDVLRLSRGMTYKAACAGLDLGGGKSVLMGPAPSDPDKREAMFRHFGNCIESLGGQYITAEDVGTSVGDMAAVASKTNHVTGGPKAMGGSGDPSPYTAHGVFLGLKAAVKHQLGKDSVEGLRILVQGVGHVGWWLAKELFEEGAEILVSDINPESVQKAVEAWGAQVVSPQGNDWACTAMDVYAPCALGGTLNENTIPALQATVVAGAANNQLLVETDAQALNDRGILYAPDYVINAGGLINVDQERKGWDRDLVMEKLLAIGTSLTSIFRRSSREEALTTLTASRMIASDRLERVAQEKGKRKTSW